MITERPTTERIEVCDWCGKEQGDGTWRTTTAFFLTLNMEPFVVHETKCWPTFVATNRAAIGLLPLGGPDADPLCIQTDCKHPQSWHEGHYNYAKLGMACVCGRLKVEDADPICTKPFCHHPKSWHYTDKAGNADKCSHHIRDFTA